MSIVIHSADCVRTPLNQCVIFVIGPKRDANGEWRRLHNEELSSLYRSLNIVRVIKSRRIRWTSHVARMEVGRGAFKILTGKPRGRRSLGIGPKRDANGQWRRLHNEELISLYRSPNIVRVIKSRRIRWAGHVARMEKSRSALKILTGKPTGKRPLGRPRLRWEDNIRKDASRSGQDF